MRAGSEPKEHKCFKNWTGRATSMEQDIIVQGFIHSEETHKLQYRFYIGDGDSSTFAQLVQKCAYGREVRKLHCANHVTVRLSDHLHGLLKKTKEYPVQARNLLKAESVSASAKGPVIQTRIDRLVKGVRTAIRNCGDLQGDVDSLQKDLENAPFHVFGRHTNCGTWCKRKAAEVPEEDVVETAKQGGLFKAIQTHVHSLIMKSDSLVKNVTTNGAENFMSLAAKVHGEQRSHRKAAHLV
ncbi:Intraflagellar transport protein 20-like protein [Frankliniella fusca]|uniref:Intraflagellar transport protein 20-like protein n=1 Tax=Frankliniella fusca TaxID=407009 RepID=A0AAE1H6C8_9NEOP|nr:Intraflagellar transport protein 20-like protein [Frankliniella fusca]